METNLAGAEKRKNYLYENRWWKLGFNAVSVVLMAVVVLILLALGAALHSGIIFDVRFLTNLMWQWLPHAILVPPVVLILTAGGLDLSIGALIGLSGMVVASLSPSLGGAGGAVVALGIALFIGLVNGVVAGGTKIHGAIVTLATATLARGLAVGISGGKLAPLAEPGLLSSPVLLWLILALSLILGAVGALVAGRRPAAKGSQDQLSWLARLVFTGLPYVFSAVMAGLVGLMMAGRLRVGTFSAGTGFEVDQVLIALLGGTALSTLPIGHSLLNMFGGLAAALAFALSQSLLALSGAGVAVMDTGKSVVLLLTLPVSYFYYFLAARLPVKANPPPVQKP